MSRPTEDYFERLYMGLPAKKNGGLPPPRPVVSATGVDAIEGRRPRKTEPVEKAAFREPSHVGSMRGAREETSVVSALVEQEEDAVLETRTLSDIDMKVRQIQEYVAKEYNVTLKDLLGDERREAVVTPRHIAMWLTKGLLNLSPYAIAERFNRDKAGIYHALEKIDQMNRTSASMHLQFERFREDIKRLHPWM